MQNVQVVQSLQSNHGLNQHTPNLTLLKEILFFLMIYDLLIEVAIVCKLHNDAKYLLSYHKFLP